MILTDFFKSPVEFALFNLILKLPPRRNGVGKFDVFFGIV